MNPLWLSGIQPPRVLFDRRPCPRCGTIHELLPSIAQTRFRCIRCSAELNRPPKQAKCRSGTKAAVQSPEAVLPR